MNRSLASLAFAAVLLPGFVCGAEIRTADQVSVRADERIEENAYLAGGSISEMGNIDGDLIAAGGHVIVQGAVRDDVFVAGGSLSIVGPVGGDVRAAGGNITLNSVVDGDLVVFGGQILISGEIKGDLIAYGGNVRIDAPIRGDVRSGGGTVFLNAPVGGHVHVNAEHLNLGKNAALQGDLTYSAVEEATVAEEARVQGARNFTPNPNVREAATKGLVAFLSVWFIAKFFMLLVGSLIIGLFFRPYAIELGEYARAHPLQTFMTGLVTMICLPVLSVILLVLIIGIPLGLLGLLSFFALGVYGHLIAPIVLGSFLNTLAFKQPVVVNWKTICVGTLVFYAIWFVPFVGWLARAFFFFLALGSTLQLKWSIAKKWN